MGHGIKTVLIMAMMLSVILDFSKCQKIQSTGSESTREKLLPSSLIYGERMDNIFENMAKCIVRVSTTCSFKNPAILWQSQFTDQRVLMGKYLRMISHDIRIHDYQLPQTRIFGYESLFNYIIILDDINLLDEVRQIFDHANIDNKGKVVVCLLSLKWTNTELLTASRYLWKLKVANAILLVNTKSEMNDTIEIYSYWPMQPVECAPTSVTSLIQDCNKQKFTANDVFMRKIKNIQQCPIRASTISIGNAVTVYMDNNVRKVRGYEGDIFNTLSQVMNFTPVIIPPSPALWGEELPNGSWTGIHGDIKAGRADVGFCQIMPLAKRSYFEELSLPFTTDRYVWILGNPPPINWSKLLHPYKMDVWCALLITTVVISCYTLYEYLYSETSPRILELWSIFFGQSVKHNYRKMGMKIFTTTWIIFSFIITNAYLGSLVSFLTAVVIPWKPETTKDLLKQKIPFGGAATLGNLYNSEDPDDYEVYKSFQNIELSKYIRVYFLVINANITFATPVSETTALLFKGSGHFYILEEPVLYYPTPFVFQRGSAYIDEFNRKIGELTEAGFIQWWISRNHTGLNRKSGTSPETALQFSQMASVFALWLIGLLSAVITFLVEITSRRNRNPASKFRKFVSRESPRRLNVPKYDPIFAFNPTGSILYSKRKA